LQSFSVGGGTAFPCVLLHFNHCIYLQHGDVVLCSVLSDGTAPEPGVKPWLVFLCSGVEGSRQIVRRVCWLRVVCYDGGPAAMWLVWRSLFNGSSVCLCLVQPTMPARYLLGTCIK